MHQDFLGQLGEALLVAAGMFWDVGRSPVLGFTDPAARSIASHVAADADPAVIELRAEEFARTQKLVDSLMDRRPELRFEYIQKNAPLAAISTCKGHLRKSATPLN